MAFSFEIKGLSDALRGIDTYSKEKQQEISDELTAFAYKTVNDAQQLAPVDLGNLRANIRVIRDEFMTKGIESGAEYSAYVEFGTGGGVNFPNYPGFEDLARYAYQFKGRGIRQINLPARPYLFPAIYRNSIDLPKHLKEILESK